MKKTGKTLVMILASAMAILLAGCAPDVNSHTHTFAEEWTSDATHHWHAATCGHADLVKDNAEHILGEWTITVQPTESSEGKKETECSVCHYVAEEIIAKLDHVHAKGDFHEAAAGTCVAKGKIEYYDCAHETCEIKLDSEGNPLSTVMGDFGPHALGTKHEAVTATCLKKGAVEYYDCANKDCSKKIDKDLKELAVIVEDFDSDNHEGTINYKLLDELSHAGTYTCCGVVYASEEKHDFSRWTVIDLPSEDAAGKVEYECIDCKYKTEITIAKLDHVHTKGTEHYQEYATCMKKGTAEYYDCENENCIIKLDEDGKPLLSVETENIFGFHESDPVYTPDNKNYHRAYCKDCGNVELEEHLYDDENYYYTITVLPTTESEGKKEVECVLCGYKKEITIEKQTHDHHKWNSGGFSGDCVTKGIIQYYSCTSCDLKLDEDGNVLLSLDGEYDPEKHRSPVPWFETTKTTHKSVYHCCGFVVSEGAHTWDDGTVLIKPSVKDIGLKKFTCTECKYSKIEPVKKLDPDYSYSADWTSDETYHWHAAIGEETDQVKDKAEHKYGVWTITKQPANDAEGKRERECLVCKYKTEETIAKLDHVHAKGNSWYYPAGANCLTRGTVFYYDCENKDCVVKLDKDGNILDSILGDIDPYHHASTKYTWIITPETHKEIYDCCGAIKTEEAAHTMHDGAIDKLPTILTKGVKIYNCTVCYQVPVKEDIPEIYSSPVDTETGDEATKNSKYVYFGVFPQTVLPSGSSVTVDENVSVEMGGNTYYKGSDGEYYAKVKENCCDESGYTYTDGTNVKQTDANSYRYFKVEPVKWKVLTTNYYGTNRALLLAEDVLTGNMLYCPGTSERTTSEGVKIKSNNYRYSRIRGYLNGIKEYTYQSDRNDYTGIGFLQTAFSDVARALIAETDVDNSKESTGTSADNYAASYACENTSDKIFLLNAREIMNNTYTFDKIKFATDYAKANYVFQSTKSGKGCYWWLRSPKDLDRAYCVTDQGSYQGASVVTQKYGVVPALTIELN